MGKPPRYAASSPLMSPPKYSSLRDKWTWCADWLAVAVAIALPWSTTGSLVLILLWWLARFAMGDHGAVFHEAGTLAGGLPPALCALGAVGILWASVPWGECVNGLSGFYKLLAVPALLAQFRRSERGTLVLVGFAASCTVLMVASWGLALLPGLTWRGRDTNVPGILVRDYIAQGQAFTLCAFGICEVAMRSWCRGRLWLAFALLLLSLAFLANLLYVTTSRTAMVTIPILLVLFAGLRFGWRTTVAPMLALTVVSAVLIWQTSPTLRQRLTETFDQIRDYEPSGTRTSAGERLEYWRKSIMFIANAPVLGHGTGSIREQFRRAVVGDTGPAALVAANPHNQVFAVAIQLGLVGAALLLAMWGAHLLLFRGSGTWATIGLIVVVQNIIGSLFNSHLFDFTQGWIYVWGVGVLGGLWLRDSHSARIAKSVNAGTAWKSNDTIS
jgi:O-antigen ligase